jgi:hypothetical protein
VGIDLKAIKELAEAAKKKDTASQERRVVMLEELDAADGTPELVFNGVQINDSKFAWFSKKYKNPRSHMFLFTEIEDTKREEFGKILFRDHLLSIEGFTRKNFARVSGVVRANPEYLDRIFGEDEKVELQFPSQIDVDSLAALIDAQVVTGYILELYNRESAVEEFIEREKKRKGPAEEPGPLKKTQVLEMQ